MVGDGGRWRQITPSQFQWEAEALEYVRARLADNDPNQAWANFEFVSGGSLNEVDLLVTTRKGLFLIEIKSHPGRISGDQSLWTWHRPDGTRYTFDNPIFLANTKAKRLKSLLERQWPRDDRRLGRLPFIKALVFLSAPDVEVDLPADLAAHVVVRDRTDPQPGEAPPRTPGGERRFPGLFEAISKLGATEIADPRFRQLSTPQANALVEAMDKIGIKESTRSRRVGSYLLQLPAIAERGATQDFLAKHEQHGTLRRIRVFSNVVGMSPDLAAALRDAATREFLAADRLQLAGIVRALDQIDTDLGPAVVYDHHPDAVRLDRFLAERGDELDLVDRLQVVKRVAEVLHQVHGRRVTHRMLTPQSVWLRPARADERDDDAELTWVPEISDLSMAAREHGGSAAGTAAATATRFGRLPSAAAGDIELVLADPAAESYLAPEAYTDPDPDGQALDVFSVGAITYLLCAGRPPATTRFDMPAALGTEGLSLEAVLPDADPALAEVIRDATCPVVTERTPRMTDVVAGLELCIEALTPTPAAAGTGETGEGAEALDPLAAQPGDVLGDRYIVKEPLGQGSTARALLCTDADAEPERDVVLKIPLTAAADERMRREAEVLDGLRHPAVVELLDTVELAGRTVLVLAFAGKESLSVSLRRHGPASPEFLERWGTDLLEGLRYLEREGRSHRDIKPDNLGIVPQGKNDERHVVLFDFSLAGTPAGDLTAGTPGYLEPFIEQRGAWDQWAERYAVAVTLYEMATGELPRWGDGRTNPLYTDGEAQLATELFDPDLREPLTAFFARALRRDPTERFDTAEDMLRAWQRAFEHAEPEPPIDLGFEGGVAVTPSDADAEAPEPETADAVAPVAIGLPDNLALDDPITSLAPKGKLRSGLRRFDLAQVRDLADLDPATVNRTRGVSPRTRREILRLRSAVLDRFADELAAATAATTAATPATPQEAVTPAEAPGEPGTEPAPTVPAAPLLDLDALGLRLIPPRGKRGPAGAVADTVRLLLGLTPVAGSVDDWPTNHAVAAQLGLTTGGVSRNLQLARRHWVGSPELLSVTDDLVAILADLGGVAAVGELSEPLLAARGSGADDADARRLAAAVTRAVIEAAGGDRLVSRRCGLRVLVALDGDVDVDGAPQAFDGNALLDLARDAGHLADRLTAETVLVPSADAVVDLRALHPGVGRTLSDGRLVRLAAACSEHAVANPASDLVPTHPDAVEVLRWSRPALMASGDLTPDGLVARVRARFPTVDLPGRPTLDALLDEAGIPLRWNPTEDRYAVTGAEPGALTTFTRFPSRHETVAASHATVELARPPSVGEATPEVEAAAAVEDHLLRSLHDGGFVALRLPTDRLVAGRAELARFQGPPHDMTPVDLEARFLHHVRTVAADRKVRWDRLVEADEPGSANATRLRAITAPAVDAVVDEVVAAGPRVLAWFPGALVRYQGTTGLGAIDRLRDAAAGRAGGLTTLWLVVLGSAVTTKPTIDGVPVPVIGPAEWVDLTDAWLQNLHRAGGRTA